MKNKLKAKQVEEAKPGEKTYQLRDGDGLYLEVSPTGSKLWRWKYRYPAGGRERRMAYGVFPKVTLAQAREKHEEARKLLASGTDPMTKRKEDKIAQKIALENSFKAVSEAFMVWWKEDKEANTIGNTERRLENDILPILGHRPMSEIESPIIQEMVRSIEKRGAKVEARKCLGLTSQVFAWAVANHMISRNPVKDIQTSLVLKPHQEVSNRFVEPKDLPEMLQDIHNYHGQPTTVLALKIMAHTFIRTHELIKARWEEVDLEQKLWLIPAKRMKKIRGKGGQDVTTPHYIPLATQVVALLQALHKLTGHQEYLLPGKSSGHMSRDTMRKALEYMGWGGSEGEMTGHGFRGLASTILNSYDFKEDHIEVQLSHVERDSVRRVYNHAKYLPQRAQMMQWWADHLERVEKGQPLDNVLEFRKTA